MHRPREVVDFLVRMTERFVRQQLEEFDPYPVTIPRWRRRHADSNRVSQSAKKQWRTFFLRQRLRLAHQKPILDLPRDAAQKRGFRAQTQQVCAALSCAPTTFSAATARLRVANDRRIGSRSPTDTFAALFALLPPPTSAAIPSARSPNQSSDSCSLLVPGSRDSGPARARQPRGASSRARLSSRWSKKPSGQCGRNPSASISGEVTTVRSSRRSK